MTLAAAIARPLLGLPEAKTLQDLPVPKAELTALASRYDSDEGMVETFARDGKLCYRLLPTRVEGVLRRQSENVYAVDEDTEVRFVRRDEHAPWVIVHVGGLMLNALLAWLSSKKTRTERSGR